MKKISSFLKSNYIFPVLLLLFLSHFPFLNSDPDALVDIQTRGAWTDEGLYSSQIRNWIEHNSFNINENTTFVRGPLFNLIQLPFFLLFGTKLLTARLITLFFIMICLISFSINKENRYFILLLVLSTLTEFHIFQFTHYALAEMLCIGFVLLSLMFLIKFYKTKHYHLLFLSVLFISFTYFTKIQFLYLIVIPPLTILLISLLQPNEPIRTRLRNIILSSIFTIDLLLLYFLVNYYPNRDFYNYVMLNEIFNKVSLNLESIRKTLDFNMHFYIYTKHIIPYLIAISAALLISIYLLVKRNNNIRFYVILIFSLLWFLIEMHKLSYFYLPYRYLLSLIFSAGLFCSFIISELQVNKKFLSIVFTTIFIVWAVYNISFDWQANNRRTYDMKRVNNYLAKYDLGKQPAIGSWAASCTWKNKAITFPVWNNYLNYNDPINTYHPRLVIAESDEADSEKAFIDQDINLAALSDSVRYFLVWKYKIGCYWISQKKVLN